jgi:hypothetical protein
MSAAYPMSAEGCMPLEDDGGPMSPARSFRLVVAALLAVGAGVPGPALAQVPGRFYWKTLDGANAVPLIVNSLSGNTNPFDPALTVSPGASIDATMALAGYARVFPLFDRSAMAAIIVPMGRLSGDVVVAGIPIGQAASGFGDPTLELDVNVLGPRIQRSLPDVLRYEPGFSVDLLADLAVPVGKYDSSQALNIGQNRWYGRVGLPVVWQLGPWVPGRRTTLEFLPALWLFGPNGDYMGSTLKTDPMFQLDAHLTRDLTERLWVAVDGSWYVGGVATVDGVSGEKLNNLGVGFTLGCPINDNLNLTVGYKTTIGDTAPDALRMDGFMVSLVYGWHPLVEGMKRLHSGE